jgi:hypothetical protein
VRYTWKLYSEKKRSGEDVRKLYSEKKKLYSEKKRSGEDVRKLYSK